MTSRPRVPCRHPLPRRRPSRRRSPRRPGRRRADPEPGLLERRTARSRRACYLPRMVRDVPSVSAFGRDTPRNVAQILIERYREMTPAERIARVMALNESARRMATARILATYGPGMPARELQLRLASLWIDRRTMILAFGWDPEVEGR